MTITYFESFENLILHFVKKNYGDIKKNSYQLLIRTYLPNLLGMPIITNIFNIS